jgi:hypothetical protein
MRIGRFLSALLCAGAMLAVFAGSSQANTASVAVAVGGSSTQGVAETITVSGSTQNATDLFVSIGEGGSCGPDPIDGEDTSLSSGFSGDAIAAGAFSKSYSYTPSDADETYVVCAYVGDDEFDTPDASGTSSFTTSYPTASVSISVGSNATQGVSESVTVSGSTELARDLFVSVQEGGSCGPDPIDGGTTTLSSGYSGDAIAAGSFSKTYTYTPGDANETYVVCAYVDDSEFNTPDASGTTSFTTSYPAASVSISATPNPTQGLPETITVTGSTEIARDLFVSVQEGGTCGSDPIDGGTTSLSSGSSGDAIAAGSFSKTYTYTPSETGESYVVCAYVDDNEFDTPDVSATASFKLNESVAAAISVKPIGGDSSRMTITGQSQLPRKLYVYLLKSGVCAATPSKTAAGTGLDATPYNGTAVGPNAYSETYNFTPDYSGQSFTICAYVDQSATGTPDASSSTQFTTGTANASIHVSAPSHANIGDREQIAVTGTTQIPAIVGVKLFAGASSRSIATKRVPAGSFKATFAYRIRSYGKTSIEASVTEGIKSRAKLDFVDTGLSVPDATPVSPVGGLRGSLLNPTFSWKAPAGSAYAVLIDSVASDGKTTKFMQLQANGYSDLSKGGLSTSTNLLSPGSLTSLRRVARFAAAKTGLDTARLDHALPPGKYAWQVVSAGPTPSPTTSVVSAARSFTVLGPPLTHLHVSTEADPGKTYKYPGYSLINISTSPYVRFKLQIRAGGNTQSFTENLTSQTTAQIQLTWSCAHPAQGRVPYTVQATDQLGHTRVVHGSLVYAPVTLCSQLHAHLVAIEQALQKKQRKAAQQALRRQEEQQLQEEEAAEAAQEAQYNRFVHNCKTLGGTPVTLEESSGDSTFCRAPWGGYMNVPD